MNELAWQITDLLAKYGRAVFIISVICFAVIFVMCVAIFVYVMKETKDFDKENRRRWK